MTHYRGWDYDFSASRPASGQWRATRAGVGMNTNSEEGLKRMIDQRCQLEAERHNERAEKLGPAIVKNLNRNVRLDNRPDITGSDKKLLLPEVVDFDELFKVTGEKQRWPFNATRKNTSKISSWLRFRHGKNIEVKPSVEVLRAVRDNMLDLEERDEIYFEVIEHENGWALVIAQYNLIIGSHWIAYIDASTLPEERS